MLRLQISSQNPDHQPLRERIEGLTIAKQIQFSSKQTQPILTEGETQVEGVEAIQKHLDEYLAFHSGWNQCCCDDWEGCL
ncbi:MAG: hypothetical protein AAF206_02475 [Bacteroidota bacterium]